jgi:hypothetical protein
MIDKIVRIHDSLYIIVYQDGHAVRISSDVGNALALVEEILSPKFNMTYTSYFTAVAMEGEETCPIIAA